MKTPNTPRSTSIPSYLQNAGIRHQERQRQNRRTEEAKKLEAAKKEGRMTTAQFHQEHPDALNHGHGNFEDSHTGQIWEVRNGVVYRRPDEALETILAALNNNPQMSDEEYSKLIKNSEFGIF